MRTENYSSVKRNQSLCRSRLAVIDPSTGRHHQGAKFVRALLHGVLLSLLSTNAVAADGKLHRSEASTRVEYRHDTHGLLHALAQTEVTSSVGAFLHLLENTERISEWATNTYRAALIATPAPRTHVVHT